MILLLPSKRVKPEDLRSGLLDRLVLLYQLIRFGIRDNTIYNYTNMYNFVREAM